MLSHTAWYGGKLTMTSVGSPLEVSIPTADFSGAFWNVFALGHFNHSTTTTALFGTFTENIKIKDVDFDLVSGGGEKFVFIAGATRQVRCGNLRMIKSSSDNADRAMLEATWGGDNSVTYAPYDLSFYDITMFGSSNTSDLTRGIHMAGVYDTSFTNVYATGLDKAFTWYVGDPGDPRGTGDAATAGVPASTQKGKLNKGLSLTNFRAEDFNIAIRVLGDAAGSTHEERRSHDLNVVISNVNLRGQGSGASLGGSWTSNLGVFIDDAHNVIVRDGVITECFTGVSISGPATPAQAVSGITRSGQVATLTTSSAHQIEPDDEIVIIDANQSEYNGVIRVDTVPTTTTLTYEVAGSPTTPATGTILAGRFTPPSRLVFEDLEIFNNARNGIASGDLNRPIIRGCKIYNSRLTESLSTAAHIRTSTRGGLIEGNTFSLALSEVTPYAIYNTAATLLTGPRTLVRNNIVLGAATVSFNNGGNDLVIDGSNVIAVGVTPSNVIGTLANDATPSIAGGESVWKTGGTTTITDFDDGLVSQTIAILAEHSVTITDGSPIVLSGSVNYDMTTSDTLVLRMFNDQVWHEMSRSVN